MRELEGIIVHTSDTPVSWMKDATVVAQVTEIRRWHVEERGWSDIGYHYVISRSGEIAEGRPLERIGAHTKGHNTDTVGICLVGGAGSSATDRFSINFTPKQDVALRKLIASLQMQYGELWVRGHNEFAAKACPGFNVQEWFFEKKPKGDGLLDSGTNKSAIASVVGVATPAVASVSGLDAEVQKILVYAAVAVVAIAAVYIISSRRKKQLRGIL